MKKRFALGIRQKLLLAFLLMIVLLCVNAFVGISINRSAKNMNKQINDVYKPLVENLSVVDETQRNTVKIARIWIESRKLEDKQTLKKLVMIEYPQHRLQLGRFISELNFREMEGKINLLIDKFDQVVDYEKELMDMLTSQADFENQERINYCRDLIEKNIIPASNANTEMLNSIRLTTTGHVQKLEGNVQRKTVLYNLLTYIITGILILMIITLIVAVPFNMISRLKQLGNYINEVAQGSIPEKVPEKSGDELGLLENDMNLLISKMKGVMNFAVEMGKGNLNTKEKALENWGVIGSALEDMKKSLVEISEEQVKRREKEELNAWISKGIAHFNELLRMKNSDIEELSYEIVKELVKYINAVIGGVYIVKKDFDGNEKLEICGLFAYERKRYVESRIEPGEGLIGTAYVERHKIYMREVPENYLKISSGLGEANPNELLIIPLLHNERIHGVMEIATLEAFEDYKIEFVEKIAEGLASTISSVLINTETARLLSESNEKAEKLHSQEEELRQNMEELQAAQEEKERQSKHIEASQKNLEEIIENIPLPVFVKDENGNYIMVNKEQEKLFGKPATELIGKDDACFIADHDELEEIKNSDTEVVKKQKRVELPDQKITFDNGNTKILKTIKLPILNNVSCKVNILGLSYFREN